MDWWIRQTSEQLLLLYTIEYQNLSSTFIHTFHTFKNFLQMKIYSLTIREFNRYLWQRLNSMMWANMELRWAWRPSKTICGIHFSSIHILSTHLSEVAVVDVSHHVEQKLLDSSQNLVKIWGKLVAVFRWKEGFVVDRFLDVSHDVVDVLRSRQLALLAFFVKPHVDTLTRTRLGIKCRLRTIKWWQCGWRWRWGCWWRWG